MALEEERQSRRNIETAVSRLRRLKALCNIGEPEQVKAVLATLKWRDSTKHNVAQIYEGYLKFTGKTWERPTYHRATGIPFIPTEQEIDSLISAGTAKTATLLQLLKETGARIGEVAKIEWIDIDFERRAITINKPEKRSNTCILPMSM
jgi:integrase